MNGWDKFTTIAGLAIILATFGVIGYLLVDSVQHARAAVKWSDCPCTPGRGCGCNGHHDGNCPCCK